MSIPRVLHRMARIGAAFACAQVVGAIVATSALAQASTGCGDIQKFLLDRKSIAASLTVKKGEKIDARFACGGFGKLVANGTSLLKWVDTNKDWCQIPDSFVTGIKEDHGRAVAIRGKACSVAAKQNQLEKQAKQGGGQGEGGLLGGPGLTGASKLPQGAL